MIREFKEFLVKQNALALAVAVILGAAIGKVVSALVDNVINPLLGMALPGGMRILAARRPEIAPWGWGMNGAFSVVGATLAVFIAMNWGFSATLLCGAAGYGLAALLASRSPSLVSRRA